MSAEHAPHATSKTYAMTLGGLLVLTIITVVVAKFVDLGQSGNNVLGIVIAVVKAALVVTFFMGLKYEPRPWLVLVFFPLLLVMIILGLNMPDTGLNGTSYAPEDREYGLTTKAQVFCTKCKVTLPEGTLHCPKQAEHEKGGH